jgi:hypothetical protein
MLPRRIWLARFPLLRGACPVTGVSAVILPLLLFPGPFPLWNGRVFLAAQGAKRAEAMGTELPMPRRCGCGRKVSALLMPLLRYHPAQSQPKEATSHA